MEGTNRVVGNIAGYRSMTCWTCEQQLHQFAVHRRRRIDESIILSQPAACTTTAKTGEPNSVRSVKSEAELSLDVLYYCDDDNDDDGE